MFETNSIIDLLIDQVHQSIDADQKYKNIFEDAQKELSRKVNELMTIHSSEKITISEEELEKDTNNETD